MKLRTKTKQNDNTNPAPALVVRTGLRAGRMGKLSPPKSSLIDTDFIMS